MDAEDERAMDGLAKSRYHEAKRPSEHQQTGRSADLLHSSPNGRFARKPDKSTQKCEEPKLRVCPGIQITKAFQPEWYRNNFSQYGRNADAVPV